MIYLFSFLMDVTINLLMLGLIFRARDIGASPTELGVVGGSAALPYALLCFILARRLSRLDARVSMAFSSALLLILCLLSGMVASVPLFVLIGLLLGAVTPFFWPPLEHYIGQRKSPEQLYRDLSRFNLWWCSGYVVGPALCGLLHKWNVRLPFLVAGACLVPIIIGSPFLRSKTSPDNQAMPSVKPSAQATSLQKKKFFLTTARIFIFLTYASAGCIFALFPKLGKSLDFGDPAVGYIISFLFLGQLLSFSILMKTRKWRYNVKFLLGGQAVIAAAFIAVFVSNHTVIFAGAFAVIGVVSGLCYFSSLFYTLHEPVFRSSLAGVHEGLLASGRLFGPIFFGAVAGASNLKVPYLVLAFIFAIFALWTFLQSRRLR